MNKDKVVLFPLYIVATLCVIAIVGDLIFVMRSPIPVNVEKVDV